MSMTPKSISLNESSGEGEDIVMQLNSSAVDRNPQDASGANNFIKFKLDEVPEQCKKSQNNN